MSYVCALFVYLIYVGIQAECMVVNYAVGVAQANQSPARSIVNSDIPGHSEFTANSNFQEKTYFKTLLEAGNSHNFEKQFKDYELTGQDNGDITLSPDRTPSVAERVLRFMDTSVNPCDNFFKFACGGFIQNTSTPNGFEYAFQLPRKQVTRVIKTALQREPLPTDKMPLLKAKRLFRSCINTVAIENHGVQPILKFLAVKGGMPVLGAWNQQNFDRIDMIAHTRPLLVDYGFHYQPSGTIIGMIVQKDFRTKGKYAIYLDQPGLGQYGFSGLINHEVYRLGKGVIYNKAYEEYLVDVAVSLGARPDVAKRDMCDVVNFETELAKIMLFEEERRLVETRYNKISILELSMRYPRIDWLRFFQKVLSSANIHITISDHVILWASPYYDKLDNILARTSKRTLANYILFRAIQPLLPSLNRRIQYLSLRYTAVINGASAPRLPERSEFCTGIVNTYMPWVTSKVYIENGVRADSLSTTMKIKEYVRTALLTQIQQAKWLDKITKNAALKKMISIKDTIGYPAIALDDAYLRIYYNNFIITDNFFENMQSVLRQNYIRTLIKLVNPPVSDWLLPPSSVNAWHNLGTTTIEIPAGIIQEPFFSPDYPPAMNFGGIGGLIAHEYVHGFEVTGMKFDWNGIIRQTWSDLSVHNFGTRANCLVNQYSNYYLPDADLAIVNGNKTLNENIPDNVGLQSAFYAYRHWKTVNKVHDGVPGLPYTGEELYFINFARKSCIDASPVFLRKLPYIDHHSIDTLRIIGPLQNSPEFSTVFQCPIGTFMNPVKKCKFW